MARSDNSASTGASVTEIRLSGSPEDTQILVSVLERLAAGLPVSTVGLEILTRSAAYPNRREPGQRVYLNVRVEPRRGVPEAAGNALARMRPDQRAAALARQMTTKKGDAQ